MTPTLPQSHSQITQRVVVVQANKAQAEIDYREINNSIEEEQPAFADRIDTYMNNLDTV